ncbi:hypothetical protein AVEN_167627-1 [Araneus ventricosus]|uniref:Uncharacterized protein n=1 Tax=Araneus ventricosus TaxID=182803 RepID=A0A4Y2E9G6_ARAVE|nr:hypothetical protein AVEN_167627-1 [Araneus ventricosus]
MPQEAGKNGDWGENVRWEAPVKINLYRRPTSSNSVFKTGGVISGDLNLRVVLQQHSPLLLCLLCGSYLLCIAYIGTKLSSCLHMTFTSDRARARAFSLIQVDLDRKRRMIACGESLSVLPLFSSSQKFTYHDTMFGNIMRYSKEHRDGGRQSRIKLSKKI